MKNVISVSGGKDSTAMLLLAIERGVEFEAVFADTGHEHPLTIEYVREYLPQRLGIEIRYVSADFSGLFEHRREVVKTKWVKDGVPQERIDAALEVLKPTGKAFLDLCLLKGRFPSTMRRFCTAELKTATIKNLVHLPLLAAGEDVDSWQGIRHDESRARACAIEHQFVLKDEASGAELWNYRPILGWTAADCFSILKRHMVAPNPLYKLGMTRVGCMPCINCRKSELAEISQRFPEEIDRVEQWERLVAQASKRGGATFFPTADNHGTGIREVCAWSRTARGGRQYGLFEDAEELPACSSQYGLCE